MKLGHSWFRWKTKSEVVGWLDNSEKGDVSGNFERLRGWSRGCTPPQEQCSLPPTYCWVTWHLTRAFLISMKNEKRFSGWLDNSEKEDVSGHCERLQGWSSGCTPPQECCRLLPTYFWTTWHQTRGFLIAVNYEKWCGRLVGQFWKRRCVWALWALARVILRLHSTSGTLPTTAYLVLGHMALK